MSDQIITKLCLTAIALACLLVLALASLRSAIIMALLTIAGTCVGVIGGVSIPALAGGARAAPAAVTVTTCDAPADTIAPTTNPVAPQ